MLVVMNTIIFAAVLGLGIFLVGAAISWFFAGIDGFAEGFGAIFFLLAGLALTWIGWCCMYCGHNSNVHFEMKNADGKVITKDVKPFEYMHDGNCFSFVNDDNRYCGWEVNYKYE
mgnify:CR=1 FL=1